MSKVTKTEKILRKATSKWEKFLAEGAFNDAPVNEMTMGERGMVDAQDGNPPSKIGGGNEEYMAAFNAVMQKMGKEPLPIVKPDQKYLDALQRGNLEEAAEADPRVVAMQGCLETLSDLQFDSLESALDNMNTEVIRKLSIMMKELDFKRNKVGNIAENEKKTFQVGEFVYIVNGSLKGASGKILEPVTTSTGEEGFAIELYSDAKMKVFGKRGDEVIALPQDLESGGTTDDMELYDIDEAVSGKEQYYLKQQNRAKGAAMALLDSAEEFSRMPSTEPASSVSSFVGRQANIIVDAMVALERMITSDSIDERSADDERDLEEPVKFGSGAKLEFDPEEEKFYDRGRDMYIDDPEEEDNLTREDRTTMSSDPELDQIEDIARDMLEAGIQNSRIPVGLMGVASALKAQGFDATVSSGVLNIDGKYFMGKKENFDISPGEDVRQLMGYVLGFMG